MLHFTRCGPILRPAIAWIDHLSKLWRGQILRVLHVAVDRRSVLLCRVGLRMMVMLVLVNVGIRRRLFRHRHRVLRRIVVMMLLWLAVGVGRRLRQSRISGIHHAAVDEEVANCAHVVPPLLAIVADARSGHHNLAVAYRTCQADHRSLLYGRPRTGLFGFGVDVGLGQHLILHFDHHHIDFLCFVRKLFMFLDPWLPFRLCPRGQA